MKTIDPLVGTHIRDAIRQAVLLAEESGEAVEFTFNDQTHTVSPSESYETAKARIGKERDHRILERDEEIAKFKDEREHAERAFQDAIAKTGDPSESGMRDQAVPTPESLEELSEYIDALVQRPHDYGTCVYAMSMAAVATFNYVASEVGATGFQASCADMDILRRTRGMEHGFRVIDYANILYPQYWKEDVKPIFQDELRNPETRSRFADEARNLLETHADAHEGVRNHWKWLVSLSETTTRGKP